MSLIDDLKIRGKAIWHSFQNPNPVDQNIIHFSQTWNSNHSSSKPHHPNFDNPWKAFFNSLVFKIEINPIVNDWRDGMILKWNFFGTTDVFFYFKDDDFFKISN